MSSVFPYNLEGCMGTVRKKASLSIGATGALAPFQSRSIKACRDINSKRFQNCGENINRAHGARAEWFVTKYGYKHVASVEGTV